MLWLIVTTAAKEFSYHRTGMLAEPNLTYAAM